MTTLVKFGAPWCGPCKMMEPILDRVARHNPWVIVTDVDVDQTDPEVVKAWGVTGVPALFFVDHDGVVQDTHVGALNQRQIEEKIDALSS